MSQELLYTSAPEGLNPSDQGFCTVVCTQGMPRNLKEFLESLSGYRQADHPPHPVNFSHLIHSVGGKRFHVLSRVGDYKKDYSGRSNKLAHHVALTTEELPGSGPAALLGSSLFKSDWDGRARWEPQGPLLPPAPADHGPCRSWEEVTGDAGWAGLLAEASADGSNRPMYVIFAPGQDVLSLVREALGILPREKVWTTSFSTYFTRLPAGVDCLWRFVLAGSPEAQQARAAGHSRTIDLVELEQSRRRAPAGNPYIEAARTGRVIESAGGTLPRPGNFSPSAAAPASAGSTISLPAEPSVPASPFAGPTVPASPFRKPFGENEKPSRLPVFLGVSAAVLLLAVVGLAGSIYYKLSASSNIAAAPSEEYQRRIRPLPTETQEDFESPIDKANRKADENRPIKTAKPPGPIKEKPRQMPDTEPPPAPPQVEQLPWNHILKTLNGNFFIPLPAQTNNLKEEIANSTQIFVDDPKQIGLTLFSSKGNSKDIAKPDSGQEGLVLEIQDGETDEGKTSRRWIVQWKIIHPTKGAEFYPLGTFELTGRTFTFQWKKDTPSWMKTQSLQFCLLEIAKGEERHTFRLAEPEAAEPQPVDLVAPVQEIVLDVKSSAVEDPNELRLDLTLVGAEKPITITGLKVDEIKTVPLGQGGVEFDLTLRYDERQGPYLEFAPFTSRQVLMDLKGKSKKPPERLISIGASAANSADTEISIEESRFSIRISELERISKQADEIATALLTSKTKNRLEKDIPEKKSSIASLQKELEKAKDEMAIASLQGQIETAQRVLKRMVTRLNAYNERIEVMKDQAGWSKEMLPRFQKLKGSLKVSYSIYTVIRDEKIFLAKSTLEVNTEKPEPTE